MNTTKLTAQALSPCTLHIVSQTHWDREWYLPHQTTIGRLLHVMTEVVAQLESGQLETFLFDGQTAAFEDLMQHAEEDLKTRVSSLCAAKRIILGPWYVMADEFLCAGESLLRNLEFGLADAKAAGNCQQLGYLPDNFGHVSQMPQILRNFNIHSAVLWRGADAQKSEFDWQGLDGSVVDTVFLTQGYYQHPFNVPDWRGALGNYLALIAPRTAARNLLLTQGGDHLQPVAGLADKLAAFNAEQTEFIAVQSTLENFTQTVMQETIDARQIIVGELRHNTQAFVLPDVLSTRRYLKYLNQTAEDALLGRIEPLYAMLQLATPPPAKYLEATWRLLVQQHAHDSICGCSVDSVHAEMQTRYVQIMQRIDALQTRASAAAGLVNLTQHSATHRIDCAAVFADDATITLFNPSPKAFSGITVQRLFLKGAPLNHLNITNFSGHKIAASVLNVEVGQQFHSPLDDFPERIDGAFYTVAMAINLAGTAALGLRIVAVVGEVLEAKKLPAKIENQHYAVWLEADSTLTILDKRSNTEIKRALSFVSTSDAGDSYNYSPPAMPTLVQQSRFTQSYLQITPQVQELGLTVEMLIPEGLAAGRVSASTAEVVCGGTLRIRLCADGSGLQCHLNWVNRARDQRTRLQISLPDATPLAHTYSDGAFSWDTRPLRTAQIPATISRQEMAVAVEPSYSTIVAGQLYFCHRAMQEYEMQQSPQGGEQGTTFMVTMIRSIGWMSRRDLITRGVGAGPDMETPEAQCLGENTFDFEIGLVPLEAHAATFALNRAQYLRRPVVRLRGYADSWQPALQISNEALQVSSLRRVGDFIELRVWNPLASIERFSIDNAASWQWMAVYADRRPVAAVEVALNTFVLAPFAMLTLRAKVLAKKALA